MGWNWKGEIPVQVFIDSPDSLLANFLSGNEIGRLIIVTGPSGLGKTRWCLGLAERATALGIKAVGLVSPAVFEDTKKVGIDLLNLSSGVRRHLAVHRGESGIGPTTTYWQFDEEAFNWGNLILEQLGTSQLLILDELGPLELKRGAGLTNGIGLITGRRYRLACVVVRPSLLDDAQELWPWGETFFVPDTHSSKVSP
jgi:nucleoside-triphosphatase